MKKKVVIIGAGVGGLATAARLARQGIAVTIFEASSRTGGKCRTEWIAGFAFDTGPSLLTLPAVYRDLFLKTGKRLEHILKLKPVDPAFAYIFADGKKVEFPNLAHHKILASITASLGESAAKDWHRIISRAEKMWAVSREPFVENELKSLAPFLKRKSLLQDLSVISPFTSLRKLSRKYTSNPYLHKIIDRYATYSGSDPRKVPAVLLSIAFVEEAFGAWHIAGGVGKLSEALETRARELGVVIHLNTPVKEILHNGVAAEGVLLESGEKITSDYVVANADADLVYNTLIKKPTRKIRAPRRNLAKSEPSLAGFSILLGLASSQQARALPHHTVFFTENYDDEFDAIFIRKEPAHDPTLYICAPNDPEMVRNNGDENWFVLVNAPRHEPESGFDWRADGVAEAYGEKIIDLLESKGLSIRNRIRVCEFRTPADLEEQVRAPGGSIYGGSSNGARAAFRRARNRSPLERLFCVGGSAHPGGGLPLVGISAEIVANAISKEVFGVADYHRNANKLSK